MKVLPRLILVSLLATGSGVLSAPMNGGFEAGGFDGWTLAISEGRSSYQMRHRAAGTASLDSGATSPHKFAAAGAPREGARFATLSTLADGNFIGQRNYHISLSQQFHLNQGDLLAGWASFFNGDYQAQDSAWVKVLNQAGNLVATPWRECSGNQFAATSYESASLWMLWSWQVPESGAYTLSLGMTTSGDNNYASSASFDHIFVVPQQVIPVPEPSIATLVAMGAALVASRRRKHNGPSNQN